MNEIKNTDVHLFERNKYERWWKRSLKYMFNVQQIDLYLDT